MNVTRKEIIAKNRRAGFEYTIEETFEAGIILVGSEVKAARDSKVNITDSHAAESEGEIILYNCHISEYPGANRFNHKAKRPRKLLLHKREIKKIIGKIKLRGYTLIVLSMYFNNKNIVKVELGLAKGKKLHDKRQSIKEKDWEREQGRAMRERDKEF